MPNFASVTLGREHCAGARTLPRHRHRTGYVCLILAGGYEEAGDQGRFRVTAGHAVIHAPFDAHLDRFSAVGADTLNLELEGWLEHPLDHVRIDDPDLIARIAERDPIEARDRLLAIATAADNSASDWPDELARDIKNNPNLSLGEWASNHKLAPATVSRTFRRVYEVSPSTYRAQMRARSAWRRIVQTSAALSCIAMESWFADQAHMTRAVSRLTGHTPARWRGARSNTFKT